MKVIYRVAVIVVAMVALWTTMPVCASEMDDRIESSARDSYVFNTYLKGDDIKIQSKDGAVTLTGVVSEESRRGLANETVAGLPGVKSVDNRLEVKGASPTPNSDVWLGEKVKTTLLFHRSVSAVTTEVDVKEGIVTLRGDAASQAQKELTTEYAKGIEGVKGVNNEMTVLKTPEMTMARVVAKIDDASITAQIKMTLLFHRSTSALSTKVETNDGAVTMYGKASNTAEKDLVTKLVNDINGVKNVNNRMTVQ
jgi:hyperosmotically inducible periplasmic protein